MVLKSVQVFLSPRSRQQGASAHCLVAVPSGYFLAARMLDLCGFAFPSPTAQKISTRSRDAPDRAVEQLVQRAISLGVDLEQESMTRVRHRGWCNTNRNYHPTNASKQIFNLNGTRIEDPYVFFLLGLG